MLPDSEHVLSPDVGKWGNYYVFTDFCSRTINIVSASALVRLNARIGSLETVGSECRVGGRCLVQAARVDIRVLVS